MRWGKCAGRPGQLAPAGVHTSVLQYWHGPTCMYITPFGCRSLVSLQAGGMAAVEQLPRGPPQGLRPRCHATPGPAAVAAAGRAPRNGGTGVRYTCPRAGSGGAGPGAITVACGTPTGQQICCLSSPFLRGTSGPFSAMYVWAQPNAVLTMVVVLPGASTCQSGRHVSRGLWGVTALSSGRAFIVMTDQSPVVPARDAECAACCLSTCVRVDITSDRPLSMWIG